MEIYSKKEKKRVGIGLIILKLTFDIIYFFVIKDAYLKIPILERGYIRNAFSFDLNIFKYIISWIFTLIIIKIILTIIIKKDDFHELLVLILVIISFLPNMTLFAMSNIKWSFFWWQSFFWLWFLSLIFFFTRKINYKEKIKITSKNWYKYIFYIIIFSCILISFIISYKYFNKIYININFSNEDVYSLRMAARNKFSTPITYLRNNTMYIILPLISVIHLNKKKYFLFIIDIIFLLLIYSVDSQKAVILLFFVSILASIKINNKISLLIIKTIFFLNITIILIYKAFKNILLVDYLFKRIYFLPAIIGKCHFEYVSENQNVIFLSSYLIKFNLISNYKYSDLALPFIIGEKYFGSNSISANTGAFAGVYDYGIIGIFFIPIIYAFLFGILNTLSKKLQKKYIISLIITLSFVIQGATLPSVLLVYGLLLTLLLLYLMNKIKKF